MVPFFGYAVSRVIDNQQWVIEKYLLGFSLTDRMLIVFTSIAVIPVKSCYPVQINHICILPKYT